MRIGTCESKQGEIRWGHLIVARDAQGEPLTIPVIIAEGTRPGKVGWFSAGVHGDEINGVEVLRRFLQEIESQIDQLAGTLIFLPLVNISGFRKKRREVQHDGRDLNRCFPGNPEGSVSEQIAHAIFHHVIARCDFGVDVHDSGRGSVLLPHPRAHIMDEQGRYDEDRMRSIAVFGTDLIMLTRGMPGVMTVEASRRLGILAFTVEIGGGFILWEDFIAQAVIGLKNVLQSQGMLPGSMLLPQEQYIIPGADDLQLKAEVEGILHSQVTLGEAVDKGETLAEIVDPLTYKRQVLRARQCGVVHDLNIHGKVDVGEGVVGMLEFTTCPVKGCKPDADNVDVLAHEASDRVRLRPSRVFEAALSLRITASGKGTPWEAPPAACT